MSTSVKIYLNILKNIKLIHKFYSYIFTPLNIPQLLVPKIKQPYNE